MLRAARSTPWPLTVTLGLIGCGGTIEFGQDREPARDAGEALDARAALDAGPLPGPAPVDAGACTPRTRPTPPATWPFPITPASYTANFASVIPASNICAGCHQSPAVPPYIPDAVGLAAPGNDARATAELWNRALPPSAGAIPVLRRAHPVDGSGATPPFTPAQIAAIDAFLERAYDCAWRSAPPPQPGECPPPDTSACAP